MKKKRNSWGLYICLLFLSIATVLVVEVVTLFFQVRHQIILEGESFFDQKYSITYNGYQQIGQRLIPLSDDPQVLISGLAVPIQSIAIKLSEENASKNFHANVYYPDSNGNLSENNMEYFVYDNDTKQATAEIPMFEYPFIRIDINTDCYLEDIVFSCQPLQYGVASDENASEMWIRRFIVFIAAFLTGIFCKVYRSGYILKKSRNIVSQNFVEKFRSVKKGDRFFEIPTYRDKRWKTTREVISIGCVVLLLICIGYIIQTKMAGGDTTYGSNWSLFIMTTGILALLIYLNMGQRPKAIYLLVIFGGMVWILFDKSFNVIDEGAHMYIVNRVVNTREFPLVWENYEAVQGPVYYYAMAFLCGWIPERIRYFACRIVGLGMLIIFGYISRRMIGKLDHYGLICVDLRLQNVVWILFIMNPQILVRLTRVSNESLAVLISGAIIYLTIKIILEEYNRCNTIFLTVLSAAAFLTKATTIFLFGTVIIVCTYYKQWRDLFVDIFIFIILVSPWFIKNYITYGELTAMSGHLQFVIPIINPERVSPDILLTLINFFDNFFFPVEAGYWYYYPQISTFLSVTCLFLFCTGVFIACKYLISFCYNGLHFCYDKSERQRMIVITFVMLPVASMVIHAISSSVTYINSLSCNRYFFLLNGAFASLLLMGASGIERCIQKYLTCVVSFAFAVLSICMIFGYINIISLQ